MFAVGLRLALLLVVLVQYSPMRLCALERVTIGASCHDRIKASVGGSHEDEQACGTGRGGDSRCVCEQPKLVGDQQPAAHAAVDLTHQPIVAVVEAPVVTIVVASSDPDPQRDLLASLQLPLLI